MIEHFDIYLILVWCIFFIFVLLLATDNIRKRIKKLEEKYKND